VLRHALENDGLAFASTVDPRVSHGIRHGENQARYSLGDVYATLVLRGIGLEFLGPRVVASRLTHELLANKGRSG